MKSYGIRWVAAVAWTRAVMAWLAWLGVAVAAMAGEEAATSSQPRILGIEYRGAEWVIRVAIPPGVARVVIEGCRREDLRAWIPKATARVAPHETEMTFSLVPDARMEMFRVRVDTVDPLPAEWYSGETRFPVEPASDPFLVRRDAEDAAGGAGGGGAEVPRTVVESDIWSVRGDTMYFFNELRGLQVIDLSDPDAPKLRGTFRLPGSGEQMYLAGNGHVVLLAHDPCRQWGVDAESAVWVIDTTVVPPVEVARLPMKGRLVESRWVGTALYVATETWEPVNDGSGSWRSGTQVASFDFSVPSAPVARGTLWIPGSGNVVTATDRFLFVAVTDYSKSWPWKSQLEVLDITATDGSLATWVSLPLSGRVPDKFKIDLLEDTLRVVVEAVESPEAWRFVTVLETYRIPDPRSASPLPMVRLDRLELARGERLFATRFDGTRGYVVTFQRVDPLWVIDLSNPSDLRVAGEVEIPGWSTYLRPMGDRLLTLGVDDARGWRVAVQLFDVSDPSRPTLLAKVPLGEDSSWSEANTDEKAFGVFPEAGLLLVPVSEWKNAGSEHGVQLLDFGPGTITKRGFLKSDSVIPRRAALYRDRLLTVSGRALVSANIGDRDEPSPTASMELAYPVERVLAVGEHLLEFQAGSVRIRRPAVAEAGASVSLGDLPVLGAVEKDGHVHLLQGRAAEVAWDYDEPTAAWTGRTNAGVLVASVWDARGLPALTKSGEGKRATDQVWLGEAEAHWLRDGLLLWSSGSSLGYPWRGGVGGAERAWVDGVTALGGGLLRPWRGEVGRALTAVDVADPAAPRIVSEVRPGLNGSAEGKVAHAGALVFTSRLTTESEVTGTNDLVEMAWFAQPPRLETNVVVGADGTSKTNVLARNEGEWRSVTNRYPVLRWWSRHELDVVDYGTDPGSPAIRPPVEIPGGLEGISGGGALLFTAGWRTGLDGSQIGVLDASAYDGIAVHRIDSVTLADGKQSESYAIGVREGGVYVARGGWNVEAKQRLEVWGLGDSGKWVLGASAALSMAPGELKWFGDMLLVRNGGEVELFQLRQGGGLESLPGVRVPGCYAGELSRADGDGVRGLWLPLWEYGAVRVGP